MSPPSHRIDHPYRRSGQVLSLASFWCLFVSVCLSSFAAAHAEISDVPVFPFVHVSYNAGIAIREGAGIAVANGLPWSHALKALTVNPAETWGIAGHYGTLEPGKDADIVVWDGDPLEPSSAPVMVFVRGRQISLETRQTDLEKRYRPGDAGDA